MHAISPLDGRYRAKVAHLAEHFSEMALVRARLRVEVAWLLALDDAGLFPALGEEVRAAALAAGAEFSEADYARVKEIEAITRHDVKAVERLLREKLPPATWPMLHFGLTSEDVNNLAWTLEIRSHVTYQQLPALHGLCRALAEHVRDWRTDPFPSRTHGQPASPSTAGKEMAVFLHRLLRQVRALRAFRFTGKLAGATGTYSSFLAAFPEADWPGIVASFMDFLDLDHNPVVTQVEDHDTWAAYFDITRRINSIVVDLDRDLWEYISRGWLVQKALPGQVGSSTMPHKINPIRFENSEGNADVSSALLGMLSDRLPRSRMQRDLSDSTVTRNIGVALAHHHLALSETTGGLGRLGLHRQACLDALDATPELLAEPIQTILRVAGVDDPYEILREATQGRRVSREELVSLADDLDIDESYKQRIRALDVRTYVGLAPQLAQQVLDDWRRKE